jgi:hypothetical protein
VDTSYHHAASESPTFGHSHDPEKAALGGGIHNGPYRTAFFDGLIDADLTCTESGAAILGAEFIEYLNQFFDG